MLVGCPKCRTRFRIDDDRVRSSEIKLRCTRCRTVFRVAPKAAPPQPPPAPAGVVAPAPAAQPTKVVIGHESPSFCQAVQGILAGEPFQVFSFNDGIDTLEGIRRIRPQVVLIDVALPRMFGFELCEAIRAEQTIADTRIILIAAIYDKTRYKRHPASLYGADDYIEKHHIPDDLVSKIYRLVSHQQTLDRPEEGEKPAVEEQVRVTEQDESPQELAQQEAAREELKRDEETLTIAAPPTAPALVPAAPVPAPPAAGTLPEPHVKAKRLARIIVSDISLYNQGKVQEGVRNGTFFDILEGDIQEGRALYDRRISEEVRSGTRYLEEAFDDLIQKVRKELGL